MAIIQNKIRWGVSPIPSPRRLLRGGVSSGGGSPVNACGFSAPAMVSNVIGWWDASCLASLTFAGGNNVLVIADGSGLVNDMTRSGAAIHYPQYISSGFNGGANPYILITQSDIAAFTCNTAFPMGTGNTLTAWCVSTFSIIGGGTFGRQLSYTQPDKIGITNSDAVNVGSWCIQANASLSTSNVNRNSITTATPSGSGDPAGHTFILTINSSGVMTFYLDGVAGATATSSGNWVDGGAMCLGVNATGDFQAYWRGRMAEAGVATSFTNPTNVAALHSSLAAKWGL